MKCEDLWNRVETGNVFQRLVARWHAARCPTCAESLRRLNAVKRGLARVEPLSAQERRWWQRAAEVEAPRRVAPRLRLAVVAGLVAALLVALVAGWWAAGLWHRGQQRPVALPKETPVAPPKAMPGLQTAPTRAVNEDALRQIEAIRSGLAALGEDLERLAQVASLLDERKQVIQLLSTWEELRIAAEEPSLSKGKPNMSTRSNPSAGHGLARTLLVRPRVWAAVLVAAVAAMPASAEQTRDSKVTAPQRHVPFRDELGGSYYVPKALKDEYDSLDAAVKELKADVFEARIDEAEAKTQIADLQQKIQKLLEQIEQKQVYVSLATLHEKTESQTFELAEAGCLFVKMGKIRIVGWDQPHVKCVLQKHVFTLGDESPDTDFEAIQAVHERTPAAEVLGLPSVDYVGGLDPQKLDQHGEFDPVFILRYRAIARSSPERLKELNPQIAEILARPEGPLGEKSLVRRLDFDRLVALGAQEIDVVRLTGLTHQEGNRQFTYKVTSEGAGAWHGSLWRRHARLTLFVPACQMVAVQGGLEGLDVESLEAALEIVGEGDRDYAATNRIKDLGGPLTVKAVPIHVLEDIRGDVSVVLTAHAEDSGVSHRPHWRTAQNKDPRPSVYRNIDGDFCAWFCRADLHLENVAGKVDVRNDFGNTVLVCNRKLAEAAHRIVSEAGHVDVKLAPDALGSLPVVALSECGRVQVATSTHLPLLDHSMIGTSAGNDGIRRSWNGFFTTRQQDPNQRSGLDYIERFRRPAAALAGLDRSPGLDLISRSGSVRIEAAE